MNGVAYNILCRLLIKEAGKDSTLAKALGGNWKGWSSVVIYLVAIGLAFLNSWLAVALYIVVAMIWFIPDRRIEKKITS